MSNLRIVAKNFADTGELSIFPGAAPNTNVNNLKTTSRSKLLRTNVASAPINFSSGSGFDRNGTLSSDGTYLYLLNVLGTVVQRYTTNGIETVGYSTIDVGNSVAISSSALTISFNLSGTKLYIYGSTQFFHYALSTPWDLTTLNTTPVDAISHGIALTGSRYAYFNSAETEIIVVGTNGTPDLQIYRFSMSTPGDLTSGALVGGATTLVNIFTALGQGRGMLMSDDGLHMYLYIGITGNYQMGQIDLVNSYDIETAIDIISKNIPVVTDNDLNMAHARNLPNTWYTFGQGGTHTYNTDTLVDISTGSAVITNEQKIKVVLNKQESTNSIVFGRHSFLPSTIINIDLYSDSIFTSNVYSSSIVVDQSSAGEILVTWGDLLWGSQEWGGAISKDEFSPQSNFVIWLPGNFTIQSLKITITVPEYSDVDINRLIIGKYIEPKYNISYNHTLSWNEDTKQYRTEGGTLRSDISGAYRKFAFSLNTIDAADRTLLTDELTSVGLRKDFFLSLFPNDADNEKNKDYSGIVKLTKVPSMSEFINKYYKSKYIMEEV